MPDDSSATASSPDSDAQPPERLKLAEQVGFYIDIWKKSVDVQQHFNDIQWRIRGLALTVATFTLGAAGIAAKDSTRIGIISLGALIAAVGLLLWYAFYFVDRYWYHVFLKSSVSQGLELEHAIADFLPKAQLTEKIKSDSSSVYPGAFANRTFRLGLFLKLPLKALGEESTMDSTRRLSWFYVVGSIPFLAVAMVLQTSAIVAVASETPSPTVKAVPQKPKDETPAVPVSSATDTPSSTSPVAGTPAPRR